MITRIFFLLLIAISIFHHNTIAENIVRRGNLLIDLDTGKITIVNDNKEYQSLSNTTSISTNTGSTTGVNTTTPKANTSTKARRTKTTNSTSSGNNSTGQTTISGTNPSPLINNNSSAVSIGAGVSDDPGLMTALMRMHTNGMTKYRKVSDYNPFSILLREHAAHFLIQYDNNIDTNTTTNNETSCVFSDINQSAFQETIQTLCKRNIFRGSQGRFRPSDGITKAEFVAGILGMIDKRAPNSTGTRQESVYNHALGLDIISEEDAPTFSKPITKYEAAMLLHKLYLTNQFKQSLLNNQANYTVISSLTDPNESGKHILSVDIASIDNKDFNYGFIDLFEKTYKLTKKQIKHYLPTSYVRYGELRDIEDNSYQGGVSLSISQQGIKKNIIQGYIHFTNAPYMTIQALSGSVHYRIQ